MTGSARVEWTDEALRQLDRAHDYVTLSNSEAVADRITEHVFATVQQLRRFPMSGRAGRVSGTRDLVLSNTPFVAAYVIERERIAILAIDHGAQRWPEAF